MKKATLGSPFCHVAGRLRLSAADHLPCVCQGLFGEVDAAEHAGDFLDALCAVQFAHGRACGIAVANLVHEQVLVALSGDLRQVSDGQFLAALTEAA
ncbi:hypothetical protein D9M68_926110 [compost metagenome]